MITLFIIIIIMKKEKIKQKKAFTLVELIIVITILAVLATIAFMSFKWYSKNARDGNRTTTIKQISNWLNLFQVRNSNFPQPEWTISTWTLLWQQVLTKWSVWEWISKMINMNKIPKDPLLWELYVYWVSYDKKQFQIWWINEWQISYNNLIPTTFANSYFAYIQWNYAWFIKFSTWWTTYIANIPSLLYWNETEIIALDEKIVQFIVHKWKNVPYNLTSEPVSPVEIMKTKYWSWADVMVVNISNINNVADLENAFSWNVLKSFGWELWHVERIVLGSSTIPVSYNSCTYEWVNIAHEATRFFYSSENPEKCENVKKEFKCDNGTLKDLSWVAVDETNTFKFSSCTDDTTCRFNWSFKFDWKCHFWA